MTLEELELVRKLVIITEFETSYGEQVNSSTTKYMELKEEKSKLTMEIEDLACKHSWKDTANNGIIYDCPICKSRRLKKDINYAKH
jgi:hypothetical protein